jgi:pyruvyl transferase EpsO
MVVSECPDLRILQLPQTIHFADPANLARSREALGAHPHLIVLARDQRSLRIAQDQLNVAARLCPDMAFAIGPRSRSAEPRIPIIWLARTDHEATSGRPPLEEVDVEVVDWVGGRTRSKRGLLRVDKFHRRIAPDLARRTGRVVNAHNWLGPWMDRMAAGQLRRGAHLLSQARVVVTDRLHGHILCLLLDIPHVVLDTGYGKLSEFLAAYTASTPLVAQASSIEEALTLARCHPFFGPGSEEL